MIPVDVIFKNDEEMKKSHAGNTKPKNEGAKDLVKARPRDKK